MLPFQLPALYISNEPTAGMNTVGSQSFGSATWLTANTAIYVPASFPVDCTLESISFVGANTTGNYDLGFYNSDFVRLASTGSTAMSVAIHTLTLGFRVSAGVPYYGALAMSSTGSTYRSNAALRYLQAFSEVASEASAFPLPATATPVVSTELYMPWFIYGVR